jgi:intracellular multiplication protein IcmD
LNVYVALVKKMRNQKNMRIIQSCKKNLLRLFSLFFISSVTIAVRSQDLGQIARQIAAPVGLATNLVQIICIICGVAMILGSLLKYKAHRQNPIEVPFSTPIMLLLFGLAVLALGIFPALLLGKK